MYTSNRELAGHIPTHPIDELKNRYWFFLKVTCPNSGVRWKQHRPKILFHLIISWTK
jgi:hypothetical protein